MKKGWFILIVMVCLLAALLLPACAAPAPAPTPTPAPAPTPTPGPAPAPTPKPSPAPTPTPTPAPAPLPAPASPKTIKFSYDMPQTAAAAVGFNWWGPEFQKRTEGRYKVETYPASSLISIPAQLDSVRSGVAEIVMSSQGNFSRDFPLSLVHNLPTLGFPGETAEDFLAAYDAIAQLYSMFPEIQAEYKGFKLLWVFDNGPYFLVSKKKEIHTAADFRGIKVGGSGPMMEIVSANGGAAVHQVPPQSYTNLDKGLIDATFNLFAQVWVYKLYEIGNYFYTQNFGNGSIMILMNKDTWNAMSSADQKIILDSWRDESKVHAQAMITEGDLKGRKAVLDAGKKITAPTDAEKAAWLRAAEPSIRKWRDDALTLGVNINTIDRVFEAWKKIRESYVK